MVPLHPAYVFCSSIVCMVYRNKERIVSMNNKIYAVRLNVLVLVLFMVLTVAVVSGAEETAG